MNEFQRQHYARIVELAEAQGGRVVSTEYHNRKHTLIFECSAGHRWTAQPYSIETSWCAECVKDEKRREAEKRQAELEAAMDSEEEGHTEFF